MKPRGSVCSRKRRKNSSAVTRHQSLLALVRIVFPAKGDLAIAEADDAMVRDGDPMGVAGQVLENMLRAAERPLGVDDPVLRETECAGRRGKPSSCANGFSVPESAVCPPKARFEPVDELAAKHAAENFDGQEEADSVDGSSAGDLARVRRRNHAVNMWMMTPALTIP